MRKNWVTASESSAALHLNPYLSRRSLWQQKLGRIDRVNYEGPAIEWGKDGEEECIEMLRRQFPSSQFYQPGTVLSVDPEIRLSCSPDQVELDQNYQFRGWEIKTPFRRPIPLSPDQVYPEHRIQCLANALCFQGRGAELRWTLYYHDRLKPDYDPKRRFEIESTRDGSESLAVLLSEFVDSLDSCDEGYGMQIKKKSEKREEFLSQIKIKNYSIYL